jgi:hypothetical protein
MALASCRRGRAPALLTRRAWGRRTFRALGERGPATCSLLGSLRIAPSLRQVSPAPSTAVGPSDEVFVSSPFASFYFGGKVGSEFYIFEPLGGLHSHRRARVATALAATWVLTLALAGIAQAAGETQILEPSSPTVSSDSCDSASCEAVVDETAAESAGTDPSPGVIDGEESSTPPTDSTAPGEGVVSGPAEDAPPPVSEPAESPPPPVIDVSEPAASPDASETTLPGPSDPLVFPPPAASTDESAGQAQDRGVGDAPIPSPLGSLLWSESVSFLLNPSASSAIILSAAGTALPARPPGAANGSRGATPSRTGHADRIPGTPGAPPIPTGPSVPSPAGLSGGSSSTAFFFSGFAALVAALSFGAARRQSRRLIPAVAVWRPVTLVSPLERPG